MGFKFEQRYNPLLYNPMVICASRSVSCEFLILIAGVNYLFVVEIIPLFGLK